MSSLAKIDRTLREFTPARVGLTRAGASIATEEQLRFQLDHALARDAVHARLDVAGVLAGIERLGLEAVALRSAVEAGPAERQTYLRRPDLGRRLGGASFEALQRDSLPPDVVFVVADGLSALAVERHALPVLTAVKDLLEPTAWRIGPVCVVSQGRVAVGDEIGERLRARAVVMLIGERPGLSAADSLGVYVTWDPRPGRTDAERNCISNVRLDGLEYAEAARRIVRLLEGARRLGTTGVALKDGTAGRNPLMA
jgi:ethanolamine ammonia-lyase small subunit